jgi:hypothetical protein
VRIGPAFPGFSVFNQQTVTRHLSYLSTSRVRAGFLAMDNLLIYGTGGMAIGRVYFSSTTVSGITPFWRQRPVSAPLRTRGCGRALSAAVWNGCSSTNWSLKAEALHYDLGTSRVSGFLQQAVTGGGAIIANTSPVSSWRNNRHHRPRRPELPPPLV